MTGYNFTTLFMKKLETFSQTFDGTFLESSSNDIYLRFHPSDMFVTFGGIMPQCHDFRIEKNLRS